MCIRDRYMGIDLATQRSVEEQTREQSTSFWMKMRGLRVTGSNFGKISKRNINADQSAFVFDLVYQKSLDGLPAIEWGKKNENLAREQYAAKHLRPDQKLMSAGFMIDPIDCWMGASPDGLIEHETSPGIIEIKCPFTGKGLNMKDTAKAYKSGFYMTEIDEGKWKLNRRHDYYAQIQGNLYLHKRQWCDFIVWTDVEFVVEKITYESDFFENMKVRLKEYYFRFLLPELTLKTKEKNEKYISLSQHCLLYTSPSPRDS
eukprot:TRINITY_DN526_c0_g1_i3.p1 TRINITY_DN526_c0_g1~~TRINITY_DN526_c0_g1_i3.p1  ORF type:complete len:275 (-),score=54.03 TRINITY_DN526_c0_g1_i3:26-802(-)